MSGSRSRPLRLSSWIVISLAACGPDPTPQATLPPPSPSKSLEQTAAPSPRLTVADSVDIGLLSRTYSVVEFDALYARYLDAMETAPNGGIDRWHAEDWRGVDFNADGRPDAALVRGCGVGSCGAYVFVRSEPGYRHAGTITVGADQDPDVCPEDSGSATVLSTVAFESGPDAPILTLTKARVTADTAYDEGRGQFEVRWRDEADPETGYTTPIGDTPPDFVPEECDG